MKTKRVLVLSIISIICLVAGFRVEAYNSDKIHLFELKGITYEVELPKDWSITQESNDTSQLEVKFVSNGKIKGGITLQNGLPNHREILGGEDIYTEAGTISMFILKGYTPAAEKIQEEWYEIAALINSDEDSSTYYIYLSSEIDTLGRDKELLGGIIENFKRR